MNSITAPIPSYSDAHVARYVEIYLDKGYRPVQARRWAQQQVAIDWLEQVDILCRSSDEKVKLMDLGTKKIIDLKLLNPTNFKHHKMFVERHKNHYIIPDEGSPQNFTDTKCWKLTYIALCATVLALNAVNLVVHTRELVELIW